MISPLNRFEGMLLFCFYFRTYTPLQICKQVRTLHISLSSRFIWCPSGMGQQEISWPSCTSPGYGCVGEGISPRVIFLVSYYTSIFCLQYMCVCLPPPSLAPCIWTNNSENLIQSCDLNPRVATLCNPCWIWTTSTLEPGHFFYHTIESSRTSPQYCGHMVPIENALDHFLGSLG